jgi:hypothetical protein
MHRENYCPRIFGYGALYPFWRDLAGQLGSIDVSYRQKNVLPV